MYMSRNSTDYGFTVCGYVQETCCFVYILQSPLYVFVMLAGLQHCSNPRSRPSAATHSDVFTFHLAAMEMIGVTSAIVFILHLRLNLDREIVVQTLAYLVGVGQKLLHILVCVERYLAVVHPIAYLRLKMKGVAVRNTGIAGVWLISVGGACAYPFSKGGFIVFLLVTGLLSLVLVTFFCTGVLCVLIRPGPGERGGDRRPVDQSKRRAFYTVAAITASLMLKFALMFVLYVMIETRALFGSQTCLLRATSLWFNIPSSLVMPLLFLCRRVKHRGSKK